MANPGANLEYIETLPGVQPNTDATPFATKHYTYTNGMRFRNNVPEKNGGYVSQVFANGATISGISRNIYSVTINGVVYTLIGTHLRLYVLLGSVLTNITPLNLGASTAIGAGLATLYGTLANNPITTQIGSNVVTVADTSAARFRVGDAYTLSGATATGGIAIGVLNIKQTVQTIGTNKITFVASTTATSTATGGGNAVVRATGMINVTISNTMTEGDRVSLSGAVAIGGVTALQINLEAIARNVTAAGFNVMTAGTATSSASAGGGAGTIMYNQIGAGLQDQKFGQGYGMELYGTGLYGTARVSSSAQTFPRQWYFDRYGDYMLMTPGNQTGLYQWDGNILVAPIAVANAPTAINYFFVSDNTVVTFGNNAVENRITASDQGNYTTWSGTAQNQYFDYTLQGAGRLLGHIKVQSLILIFTQTKVYSMRQVGLPTVWQILPISNRVGMIAPLAGVEVNGVAYWQGLDNFYMWMGAYVQVMSANSQPRSTIHNYVFKNINFTQASKAFAWYYAAGEEIRFHYPMSGAAEPGSVAVTNVTDMTWWPDTIDRTAVERPDFSFFYPNMISFESVLYQHESAIDADGSPLSWTYTTNLRTLGKKENLLTAFIPDAVQTGNISVTLNMQQWPNSSVIRQTATYPITPNQGRQETTLEGRFWNYTVSGSVLGQTYHGGKWGEERQLSGDGK